NNSQIIAENYPNGIRREIQYNPDSTIKTESILNKDNEPIYTTDYEYNSNQDITKKTTFIDDTEEVTTYEYDKSGRLTKATYPDGETEEYIYDKTGNRLQLNTKTYGKLRYLYDEHNHLTKVTDRPEAINYPYQPKDKKRIDLESYNKDEHYERVFTYDLKGNVVEENGTDYVTYEYNSLNQLVRVQKNGNTVEYGYDPSISSGTISFFGTCAP
ncbi:MAG: RHS repeat domain-containing protein, partial [Candidatus Muiribacteriaceae bacterium]